MTTQFDPFVLSADPFPAFAVARSAGGVLVGSPPFPGLDSALYLFSRGLVASALKHPLLLQAPPGAYQAVRESLIGHRVHALLAHSLLLSDPPRHGVLRRPLAQAMTPAKGAALMQRAAGEAQQLVTRLASAARFDAIGDLAVPFALSVLGKLLGMAMPDAVLLKTVTAAIARALDLRRTEIAHDDCRALEAEIERSLSAGDVEPGGLAALMLAEEAAGRWTHEEVLANIVFMLFAGQETTIDAFGNALMALDDAPAQRAMLDQRRVNGSSAVEELLRVGTPVLYAGARIAAENLEIDGIAVSAGAAVVPVLASANRDTAVWPAGDELRLESPGPEGITFGAGLHVCLGRHIAHAEIASLMDALFLAAPSWRLDRAAVRPRETLLFRGLISAPVDVTAPTQKPREQDQGRS